MFENSLLQAATRRRAISMGYLIEGILLGLLALIPLIHMEALPAIRMSIVDVPPPPRATPAKTVSRAAPRTARQRLMYAPVTVPNRIIRLAEQPEAAIEPPVVEIPGSVPWGDVHGLPGDLAGATPPPPPPQIAHSGVSRLHVGGAVEAARLIFQPTPEYPEIARRARVQGTVRLAAIISAQGAIQSLQLLSGPPLLVKAAMDAVARFRYQPTLLDGKPVEVSTEIDVNFVLGE